MPNQVSIIVAGGRNYRLTEDDRIFLASLNPTLVIQGGAYGADTDTANWARECGIDVLTIRAEWARYGISAGPIRNQRMAKHLELTSGKKFVVLFPGGKGTASMKREALNVGLSTITVEKGLEKGRTKGIPIKGLDDV